MPPAQITVFGAIVSACPLERSSNRRVHMLNHFAALHPNA